MTLTVLDASAAAAWFLPSQRSDRADDLLTHLDERQLIVPHIFPVEIRNVLLKSERQGLSAARTNAALTFIDDARIGIKETDHALTLASAMEIGRKEKLSMYDALYLFLAETEGAELASRDKSLLQAAARRGVRRLDLNDEAVTS